MMIAVRLILGIAHYPYRKVHLMHHWRGYGSVGGFLREFGGGVMLKTSGMGGLLGF